MNDEIKKFKLLLRLSEIKNQQIKGENDLLKEIQKLNNLKQIKKDFQWNLSGSSCKTVLLIDESRIDTVLIHRN